jgi:hypothetical protein
MPRRARAISHPFTEHHALRMVHLEHDHLLDSKVADLTSLDLEPHTEQNC